MLLGHDFTERRVLVVGGGPVGARKARHFAREADVLVVSPRFEASDYGGAERVRAALAPGDVEDWLDRLDPALAVAATDDADLNAAIARAAQERDVLVNRTDTAGSPAPGGVVVPATVRDDPVVIAVATGGRSPALSRCLRQRLEAALGEDSDRLGAMAELSAGLRDALTAAEASSADRRAALEAVFESRSVWTALDTPGENSRQLAASVIATEVGESV
jgi:precorrin-2 dehydrogenase/sirohydrochlorin ferrochelatase